MLMHLCEIEGCKITQNADNTQKQIKYPKHSIQYVTEQNYAYVSLL